MVNRQETAKFIDQTKVMKPDEGPMLLNQIQ